MESKTINSWDKMINNSRDKFKNYLIEEEKFLKENINDENTVLDLGCGTGRTVILISKFCKNIIGIDNDKIAVEEGVKNIERANNAKIIFMDAEKMNFPDNYFDKIFIGLTFSNFGKTREKILLEIFRVLKEEGFLLFSIYNEDALQERLKNYEQYDKDNYIIKENGLIKFNYGAVSEQFSEKEIREILENTNFEIEEIKKLEIFYLIKARKK